MDPDLRYKLTFDGYSSFEALLSKEAIKVNASLRTTHEMIDSDLPTSVKTNGALVYQQKKFRYTLQQDSTGCYLILRDAYEHEPKILDSLDGILSRLFPQPELKKSRIAELPPREPTPWYVHAVAYLSCLVLALIFFGSVFFMIYGVKKFFWG